MAAVVGEFASYYGQSYLTMVVAQRALAEDDLVAAAEQDRILLAAYQVAMYQVAAEREACAEICDRVALRYGEGPEVEHWAHHARKLRKTEGVL